MAGRSNISSLALKAMGLFGGVQFVNILCSLLRAKLVSVWIGPVGMGLFGLFNQALELLTTGVSLGIRQSSVRNISMQAHEAERDHIVVVVRRWSLYLAITGAVLTIVGAPLLSQITFGNRNYAWQFVALAVALMLNLLTNGENAILQGTGMLRRLASINLVGNCGGLLISIPLFYWLREQSILPSIIAYALCMAVAAVVQRYRIQVSPQLNFRQVWQQGKDFVVMGIYLTAGNFVTIAAMYAFNSWLNHHAGTQVVGLYQSGYTLVNRYVGLLLTALAMEYYPRISKVAHRKKRLQTYVSREIEVAMLVLAPIALLFVLLQKFIVWTLYSPDFYPILPFVGWAMASVVMRTFSWALAFTVIARGDGRIYILSESLSALCGLALNIAGYHYFGIEGLGIALLCWYMLYSAGMYLIYSCVYRMRLSIRSVAYTIAALVLCLILMLCMRHNLLLPGILVTVVAAVYCVVNILKTSGFRNYNTKTSG